MLMSQIPPSAKEVTTAVRKKGCEAIPYVDLREQGQKEYQKQLILCKNFKCDALTDGKDIEAARQRAKACRERRIQMRTIFAQAIGRAKGTLEKMIQGDPLKPDLTTILKTL